MQRKNAYQCRALKFSKADVSPAANDFETRVTRQARIEHPALGEYPGVFLAVQHPARLERAFRQTRH